MGGAFHNIQNVLTTFYPAFSLKKKFYLGLPGVSAIKNSPAMQETQEMWVQSLGWEDPLEEGMATHSSILALRIPWTGAWRATVHSVAKSWT